MYFKISVIHQQKRRASGKNMPTRYYAPLAYTLLLMNRAFIQALSTIPESFFFARWMTSP
jgi:hypothetical protein